MSSTVKLCTFGALSELHELTSSACLLLIAVEVPALCFFACFLVFGHAGSAAPAVHHETVSVATHASRWGRFNT